MQHCNSWECIEDMFAALHKNNISYLILRNYEEIDADNFYTSGHADIDFITDDWKSFARVVHAKPRFQQNDKIHYIVNIHGTDVVLDVRSVGDGYYDKTWQRTMLKNRVLFENRFYIMNQTDYYHSLIYHAILQKTTYASDYDIRLNKMAEALGISATGKSAHLSELQAFMASHNYRFTVPYDIWVPLNLEGCPNVKPYTAPTVRLRNARQTLLSAGSRAKHFILKKIGK